MPTKTELYGKPKSLRLRILGVLAHHPEGLTCEEIAQILGYNVDRIRPLVTGLKANEMIEPTGAFRHFSRRRSAVLRLRAEAAGV